MKESVPVYQELSHLLSLVEGIRTDPDLPAQDKLLLINDSTEAWLTSLKNRAKTFRRELDYKHVLPIQTELCSDIRLLLGLLSSMYKHFKAQLKMDFMVHEKWYLSDSRST
jgi:hypothetical protein